MANSVEPKHAQWYKVLLWRLESGILTTKAKLGTFAGARSTFYPLFDTSSETELHLLQNCELVCRLWFRFKGLDIANL